MWTFILSHGAQCFFVKGLSSPHLKSATAQSPKKALKPHNEYKSSEDICWCSSLLSLFKQFYYKLLPHPSFPHGHSAQLGSHRTCSWREVCPFSSEPRTENGKAAWLRTYGKKKSQQKPTTQLWAFLSSHPLFTGLSLQADHVPEYHRSLSSHSLRSCNLLRLQCQKAAPLLVVVYSSFFNIFWNSRGTQTGCYHHTHYHFTTSVVAFSCVSAKLKFNLLCSFLLCPFWDDSWGTGMHL